MISAFGRNADWLLNIQAMSSFELIIGSRRFAAVYRFLDETEAARVLTGKLVDCPYNSFGAEPLAWRAI